VLTPEEVQYPTFAGPRVQTNAGGAAAVPDEDMSSFPEGGQPLLREIKMNSAAPARESVKDLVSRGEDNTMEFKSTLRVNLHTDVPDPRMEHAVVRTISAFLNSHEGGTLIIGVDNTGMPLGLSKDKFVTEDKMNLHLVNLLTSRVGPSAMLHIKPHFENYEGARVFVIDCAPSQIPVFLKEGNTEEFCIRAGPSSVALSPSKTNEYIRQRFHV
jgi:predicted HTH transcriptional regulator